VRHDLHGCTLRLAQALAFLPEPGEPSGPQEVYHSGHYERVVVRAQPILYRGYQVIQGGAA